MLAILTLRRSPKINEYSPRKEVMNYILLYGGGNVLKSLIDSNCEIFVMTTQGGIFLNRKSWQIVILKTRGTLSLEIETEIFI